MKRDHPEYIQFVGEPFQVHLFSVEQLHMITSDEKCVLHFDATGTLPRAPKKEKKRCFYYSGVMRVGPNNRICPILELLLCQHDSNTIGYGLLNFQKFCNSCPFPKKVMHLVFIHYLDWIISKSINIRGYLPEAF
ncbi:hypothetical protein JTB14_022939 [Gonioctena quinquepunctata]|nr:hypothetical protein JTB14_022939 [Gonioctena quinquepunctata]